MPILVDKDIETRDQEPKTDAEYLRDGDDVRIENLVAEVTNTLLMSYRN